LGGEVPVKTPAAFGICNPPTIPQIWKNNRRGLRQGRRTCERIA
jgi:hypothetical protein